MQPTVDNSSVAVLAAYIEGRKDGFSTGIMFSAAAIILYRSWKRGATEKGLRQYLKNNK
jgi:hypothetical protein